MAIKGQFPAVIQLSSLNGNNGFELDGVGVVDNSGWSISPSGDVNNDGIDDIIIGAYYASPGGLANAGKTYVVFGKANWTSPISLGSLNGTNGFEIDGVAMGDRSGISVSTAGDVNSDGIQDIIIGAYDASPGGLSRAGKTFVLFGRAIWATPLALSSLNGTNGFELDGVAINDYSGVSVSGGGDVNNDGIQDIIIGAYQYTSAAGKTYVVFGKTNWTSPISLGSLNGANGFEIDGVAVGDWSGYCVSFAGDINIDGIQDIIIGAPYASSNVGKTYVIFGKATWTSPLALSSLNGANGFELDGVSASGESGWSVKAAGDVNNDGIKDIIIGAPLASPGILTNAGKTYILFGKSNWTTPISLGGLTGANGFELDGVATFDYSGNSVSSASDVNNDGINDIIIGAPLASPGGLFQAGTSYVVFGKSNWTSPISLGGLNGANGFELNGVVASDRSGISVSVAGDLNNDGVQDIIIGAPGNGTKSGKTYVVFGDSPPVLVNNRLNVTQNGLVSLDARSLSAYDLNHANISLFFVPTALVAGYFQAVNNPGVPLANFTQEQITNGTIQFKHDGSATMPSYNITVRTTGFAFVPPQAANISFSMTAATGTPTSALSLSPTTLPTVMPTNVPSKSPTSFPTIIPSQLPTNQSTSAGQTFSPTATPTVALTFLPSLNPTGFPSTVPSLPPTQVPTLLPSSIPSLQPSIVPSNFPTITPSVSSTSSPSFQPTALPSIMPSLFPSASPSLTPTPAPINVIPRLLQNSLTLSNGEMVILSSMNLQASETNFNISQLIFTVNNVQQGNFYRLPANVTAYTFPQSYIQQGRIQFRHAGTNIAPSYSVIVSDDIQNTLPAGATINFQGAPTVQINPFNMTQSGSTILGPQLITITTGTVAPNLITLQLSNLQHVTFTNTQTGLPVTSFTYADLQAGIIQLQQDGSPNAPSFTITASVPPGISSSPVTPTISFSAQGILAPRLINNYLIIAEGQTATLAPLEMYALQGQIEVPDTATFYVNNIQYGYFSLSTTPNVHVSFFTEGQLKQGLVQFTQDGSSNIPSYQLSVAADGLQSASLPAGVFFSPITRPPRLTQAFPDQTVTVGKPFSFAIVNNFVDPQGESVTLSPQGMNKTLLPQWLSYNSINQRFSGTAPNPGITDVEIVGTNVDELSAESDFVINATPNTTTSLSYLQKTIISAAVSGGVGLSFYLFKLALKRAADRKLLDSLKQNKDEFDVNVVRPIAEAISKRVKITGFSGISENTLDEFKGAVRTLIAELEARDVEIHLENLEPSKRDALINEIATQTKLYLKHKRSYGKALCSFFAAEASPEDIRKAAPEIAQKIVDVIEHRQSSNQLQMATIVQDDEESAGMDLKLKY